MARNARVIVTGDKKIDRALRKLGDEKRAKSIVRKSIRAGLKPILVAAKANAPKDTGDYRRAIKIRTVRTRKGIKLIVALIAKDLASPGQAAAIEFGTDHTEPQAPFRKAFDAEAANARNTTMAAIKRGILDAKS